MQLDRASLATLRGRIVAHFLFSLRNAIEAVEHNKLRASLTSLGILFGVASVIAMLAIGKGAEAEILSQMRLLGSNNIMITPLVEQKEGPAQDQDTRDVKKFSPGLSYADALAIMDAVPKVEAASAEIVLNSTVTREGHRRSGKLVGVDTSYFRLTNLDLTSGSWFSPAQVAGGLPVAIIGNGVRTRFFTTDKPIGGRIKVGDTWLTVIGVLADRRVSQQAVQRLGIRDANMDVYIPVHTMLRRFRDRAQITQRDVEQASRAGTFVSADSTESEEQRAERTNRNQLDRIIVRVGESGLVPSVADVTQRLLARRHNNVVDFEITIPELLLRQEQRAKTIFNVVLGAIAMHLADRRGYRHHEHHAGLGPGADSRDRRPACARRHREGHPVSVSRGGRPDQRLAGGIAGILLGVGLSSGIEQVAKIRTIVSAVFRDYRIRGVLLGRAGLSVSCPPTGRRARTLWSACAMNEPRRDPGPCPGTGVEGIRPGHRGTRIASGPDRADPGPGDHDGDRSGCSRPEEPSRPGKRRSNGTMSSMPGSFPSSA